MNPADETPTMPAFTLGRHNPDVLNTIANLSNDEIFTPPELANQMLDTLESVWAERNSGANIWADHTITFLDPFTKSGVFLREIAARLVKGLEEYIPDLQQRVNHILTKQVFGIGITQLTALLARRTVYCTKNATGKHSIAKSFDREWGNIWFERTEHAWVGGTEKLITMDEHGKTVVRASNGHCKYCGASQKEYERSESLESHAYAFIHTDDIKTRTVELFGENLHFDVVIGNPPYQLGDGGNGSSAKPIYQKFVEQAKTLEPRYLCVVIPARWYAGGKGLDEFRASMLSDDKIIELHDFPNTNDVFPGVNNRGGICYFLWANDYSGQATISGHEGGSIVSTMKRPLLEEGLNTFIRYNEGIEILQKVMRKENSGSPLKTILPHARHFSSLVSSRNPFGLPTNFKGDSSSGEASLLVHRNGDNSYVHRKSVTLGKELIDSYKLLVSRASPGSDEYPHLVLSRPIVSGPGEVATDTYIAIGPFANEHEARMAAEYMSTIFFRFMVSLLRVSINVTRTVYQFAPKQDFSMLWTDEELGEKYGLTEADFDFMRRLVKPVSWAGQYI